LPPGLISQRKPPNFRKYTRQLERLAIRGKLLLNAFWIFYASLGAFAATALVAVVGSALSAYDFQVAFHATAIAAFAVGSVRVSGLVVGCAVTVRETRLAITSMAQEIELARAPKEE